MEIITIKLITLGFMMYIMLTEKNIADLPKRIRRVKTGIILTLFIALLNILSDSTFLCIIWMIVSYLWVCKLKVLEKILHESENKPKTPLS